MPRKAKLPKRPLPTLPVPTSDPGYVSALAVKEFQALMQERTARRMEAVRIYEPMPSQLSFHQSKTRIRLLRGSNRGGKTLPAAVEVARAVLGCDPYGKYPKENGRCFAVGKDLTHVGQVMYRKLFRAGAFKIIRDEQSGQWRAFRPWLPYDSAHVEKAKEAPPLIPPRMLKEIGWENKKESVPNIARLHNGWELSFFSSLGKPPQGSDIDLGWFDEEIVDGDWFPEISARLLDRNGRLVWSATPQAGTEQLYELHERAEREIEEEVHPRTVEEYVILLEANLHISEENKRQFISSLSEEEYKVRVAGEFAIISYKIYPEFSIHVHGVERLVGDLPWEAVTHDWTRYMVVDPGHQRCAALFAAVPPPGLGDYVYLEDELYIRDCNAALFAEQVAHKVTGKRYQAFIIDAHMGIHTELGIGRTVAQQYTEALRAKKVKSISTGSGFIYGSDDVSGGILAVHEMLRIREDGTTRLRVLKGSLPHFEWEIKRYHKKRVGGQVTDKPDQRKNNHLMDSLRYLAMFNPRYVRPVGGKGRPGGALEALQAKRAKRKDKDGQKMVRLGPGRESWRR